MYGFEKFINRAISSVIGCFGAWVAASGAIGIFTGIAWLDQKTAFNFFQVWGKLVGGCGVLAALVAVALIGFGIINLAIDNA